MSVAAAKGNETATSPWPYSNTHYAVRTVMQPENFDSTLRQFFFSEEQTAQADTAAATESVVGKKRGRKKQTTSAAASPTNLVLIVGARSAETGQSWCDDCEKAEPFIHAGLEALVRSKGTRGSGQKKQNGNRMGSKGVIDDDDDVKDVRLLVCPVERNPYKGLLAPKPCNEGEGCSMPQKSGVVHPYRADSRLSVTAIPTLVMWPAVGEQKHNADGATASSFKRSKQEGRTEVDFISQRLVEGECYDKAKVDSFLGL